MNKHIKATLLSMASVLLVPSVNAQEAKEMIEASQRNDVMLSVFHNRRWDWDYLTVRTAIEDRVDFTAHFTDSDPVYERQYEPNTAEQNRTHA